MFIYNIQNVSFIIKIFHTKKVLSEVFSVQNDKIVMAEKLLINLEV